MDVDDNGRERPAADVVAGHGLIGMRERVAAYGGQLTPAPVSTADSTWRHTFLPSHSPRRSTAATGDHGRGGG